MRRGMCVLAILLVHAVRASAQPIEIVPFGGVRFGGDPFEVVATPAAVVDRQPAVGFMLEMFKKKEPKRAADAAAPKAASKEAA